MRYWMLGLLALGAACQKGADQQEAAVQTKNRQTHPIVFGYEKVEETAIPSGNSNGVYRLFASNVPPGEEMTLYGKNVGGQPLPLYLFAADSAGFLREKKEGESGGNPISNFYFVLGTFRKGEPYEYLLGSHDGKLEVSAKIIPFPIESYGKDRAYVSLTMVEPGALRYQCRGTGFLPKESLTIRSQSLTNEVVQQIKADVNGSFEFFIDPVVEEQSGGSASLEVRRTHEALMLEYLWGSEAK